jgi:hypothetical protein
MCLIKSCTHRKEIVLKNKFYNEMFKVEISDLKKYDVFNGYIDKDSLYYIVPNELEDIEIYEFKDSYKKYINFFEDIISILDKSNGDDIFFRKAKKLLQLGEIGHIGLGYSKNGTGGSGIGPKLAKKITQTGFELIQAGIKDPEIFQLVGILEEGIGADRISDITVGILISDFLNYTQNVSLKLNISTKQFVHNKINYNIPHNGQNPIIFCPKSILTDLPVALDNDDISRVCSHNEDLRNNVNQIIADGFTKVGIKLYKRNLRKLLISNPKIASEIIENFKKKSNLYDFENDPNGDFIWKEIAEDSINKYPLKLDKNNTPLEIVNNICNKFQDMVENNGLWKFFHNHDGTHKNEAFSQLLFFAIAHSYCEANNLDLSPESDAGIGPVDFKISQGFNDKINVEIKLSTNRLLHGFENQLRLYNKAEKTNKSIFFIIQLYNKDNSKIKKVFDFKNKNETIDKKLPNIVVIDATKKKSASKS